MKISRAEDRVLNWISHRWEGGFCQFLHIFWSRRLNYWWAAGKFFHFIRFHLFSSQTLSFLNSLSLSFCPAFSHSLSPHFIRFHLFSSKTLSFFNSLSLPSFSPLLSPSFSPLLPPSFSLTLSPFIQLLNYLILELSLSRFPAFSPLLTHSLFLFSPS